MKDLLGAYVEKAGPDEIVDFSLDYSDKLGADTLKPDTSDWELPTGIEEASNDSGQTSTTTTIWVQGGTSGAEYALINTVETVGGRTLVGVLRVKVKEVPPVTPPDYAPAQLQALREAYAQGVLRVEYDGKRVEYRSLTEMKTLINEIEESLSGSGSGANARRFSLASHSRG